MLVWGIFTILLSVAAPDAAAHPNLQPRWAKKPIAELRPNSSFLADLSQGMQDTDTIFDELIDARSARQMRRDYETAFEAYELRRQQGLSTHEHERGFSERVVGMAKGIFTRVRDFQRSKGREKALAFQKQNAELQSSPLVMVGALVAAASETPIEFALDEILRVTARANVERSFGQLEINSFIADGKFEFNGRNQERYRVSLLRSVPMTDVTSAVSYAGTSNVLTASLQTPLTNSLICVLDSSKTLAADSNWNESIHFKYEVRF